MVVDEGVARGSGVGEEGCFTGRKVVSLGRRVELMEVGGIRCTQLWKLVFI